MTPAMWLAWLLRGDVRGRYAVHDLDGQRAFVTWWLLFGWWEYPKVWWYGRDQADVAMERVPLLNGQHLPRLLLHLHRSRPDLQKAFNVTDPESAARYLCWYRLASGAQLRAAPALPDWAIAVTEAPAAEFPTPAIPRMAVVLWERSTELRAIMDLGQLGHRKGLAAWYATMGQKVIPRPTPLPARSQILPIVDAAPTWSTVNLVGFARAEFGIGEDVRMVSRALETAGIDHAITDLKTGADVRLLDESRAAWVKSSVSTASLKLFCITAFDAAQLFLEQGLEPFQNGFNVGYMPWELPVFPDDWVSIYGLFHEIWGATSFQVDAYRANSPLPVHLMQPAVTGEVVPRWTPKSNWRKLERPFRFIFPFDPRSTLARKNPIAAVRAFRRAFPPARKDVELVLRANGEGAGRPGWRALRASLSGDRRIRLMTGTLPRAQADRLLRSADCLLSPHRAEGLGRNIAEAITNAIPVLATGFSGSNDLLLPSERVAAKPRKVGVGEYPHAEGLQWAEPDLAHLVRAMRTVRRQRARLKPIVHIRRARKLREVFGRAAAGERYAEAAERLLSRPTDNPAAP